MRATLKCDPSKLPESPLPRTRQWTPPPVNQAFVERLKRQAEFSEMLYGEKEDAIRHHTPKNAWTQEDEELVWKLHKEGVKQKEIAKRVGRSKSSVFSKINQMARRESGYVPTRRPKKLNKLKWTPERDAEIKEYADRGMTCSMIADLTGRTPAAIYQRLKEIRKRNATECSDV